MNWKEKKEYILIAFLAVIQMLFAAYNTSPLFLRLGEDSSMYLVAGRKLLAGGKLYRDIFDHKGPVIFWINALGEFLLPKANGVWMLEILFMIMEIWMLLWISKKYVKGYLAWMPSIIYMLYMGFVMNGGNYSEEYSNLFVIYAITIAVRWKENQEVKWFQAFLLGISVAVVFFMKPNNIVSLGCIILWILAGMIAKQWKKALQISIVGLAGIFVTTGFILIYFQSQNTLELMLNATIFHNVKYCIRGMKDNSQFTMSLRYIVAWILTIILTLRMVIRSKKKGKFLSVILFGICCNAINILISWKAFFYYFQMLAPWMAFAYLQYQIDGEEKWIKYMYRRKVLIISILGLLCISEWIIGLQLTEMKYGINSYKKECKRIYQLIPQNERNDLFILDAPAVWYYENDILPNYRYFCMQTWMSKTDPSIETDMVAYLKKKKPKWLVLYFFEAQNNPEIRKIVNKEYQFKTGETGQYLYERKK